MLSDCHRKLHNQVCMKDTLQMKYRKKYWVVVIFFLFICLSGCGGHIQQWQSPDFWSLHSQLIVNSILIINLIFRLIYDVELIYIFLNSKHFALNRKAFVIAIILICFLNVLISLYIKYYVDFYRLYMYSIYPETMACYMIYCGKKSYCHINEHK